MSGRRGAWWRALRAYSLPASVAGVASGGLWARRAAGEGWSWGRLAAAAAGGAALHLAANLWNDLHDWENGTDRAGGSEGSGVLVRGELSAGTVRGMAWGFATAAAACGAWLAWTAGWGVAALGAAGTWAAWAYCGGRGGGAKKHGWGEAWAFAWMGIGMSAGGAMAQTGRWEWGAVAAGGPVACWTGLMMYANNWRDAEEDARAGVETWAARSGGHGAWWGAAAWVAGAWAWGAAAAWGAAVPWAAVAGMALAAPGWVVWLARMRRKGRPGEGDVERVAGLMGVSSAGWLAGMAFG